MKKSIFISLLYFTVSSLLFAADEPLIPTPLNKVLPRVHSGMAVQEVEQVLSTSYPKVKGQISDWSGGTGYVEYRLDDRYSILASSENRSKDGLRPVVHPALFFSVQDRPAKRSIEIGQRDWEKQSSEKGSK